MITIKEAITLINTSNILGIGETDEKYVFAVSSGETYKTVNKKDGRIGTMPIWDFAGLSKEGKAHKLDLKTTIKS